MITLKVFLIRQLSKEQLHELAKLYFDLAKGAFALAVLQTINGTTLSSNETLKITLSGLWGIVFTYLGLLSLKLKARSKNELRNNY